jgi:hypothetical protein
MEIFEVVILIVAVISVYAIPRWIAERAKPLRNGLPYRWATWCAIWTGLFGVALSVASFANNQNWREVTAVSIWGSVCLHASWGLFRRRRYGVILLLITELLSGNLIMLIVNSIYFGKRWKAMAKPAEAGSDPTLLPDEVVPAQLPLFPEN